MTCKDCGADCVGDRCQHCDRFNRRQDQQDEDRGFVTFDCPSCGGRTSGKGITCASCRRGDA